MKFNRFLSQYEHTSTSLTHGLAPVSDPSMLSDQTFAHRQAVDNNRRVVKRYVESGIVQDTNIDARRTIVADRQAARQARELNQAQDVLDALGVKTTRHATSQRSSAASLRRSAIRSMSAPRRFTEPASRPRPS